MTEVQTMDMSKEVGEDIDLTQVLPKTEVKSH
jgi:hypothetical protein